MRLVRDFKMAAGGRIVNNECSLVEIPLKDKKLSDTEKKTHDLIQTIQFFLDIRDLFQTRFLQTLSLVEGNRTGAPTLGCRHLFYAVLKLP